MGIAPSCAYEDMKKKMDPKIRKMVEVVCKAFLATQIDATDIIISPALAGYRDTANLRLSVGLCWLYHFPIDGFPEDVFNCSKKVTELMTRLKEFMDTNNAKKLLAAARRERSLKEPA